MIKILNANTDFTAALTDLFYNYDCEKYFSATNPDWSICKSDNTDKIVAYNKATKQAITID